MTIGLQVTDYRGISNATLQISKTLTLVAGLNGAGKSSLFECLAACLTGIKTPAAEVKVGESHMLVRDGGVAASATLSLPDGSRTIQWSGSNATVVTTGKPPHATEFAAGLKDFLALKLEDRAKKLQEYLQFDVTEEHLQAALPDVAADRIKLTWGTIKVKGWDGALEEAKKTGTKLKGQWEQLTGANWKPTAVNWQPEGIGPKPELSWGDAQKKLEEALKGQVLVEAEKQRLTTLAESLPRLVEDVNKYQESLKAAEAAYREAQNNAPSIPPQRAMECPRCQAKVVLMSNLTLAPADGAPNAKELEELKRQKEAHGRKVDRLRDDWINSRTAYDKVAEQARQAHVAKLTLEEDAARPKVSLGVDEAREAVRAVERYDKLIEAATKANQVHANWRKNQNIIDVLSPDGLRQQRLSEALEKFNKQLKTLCDMAGWADVVVRPDMSVVMGKRPLSLVSGSERFRARVTIQCALAQLDKSDMVAIDAADILDNAGRAGLAKLSAVLGVPIVVFLMASKSGDLPDLAADGRGLTHWVAGHTVISPKGTAA